MSKKHKVVVEPTPYATLKDIFREMVSQFTSKGHWRPVSVDTDLTHGLAIFDSDSIAGLSVTVNWHDNQQWIAIHQAEDGYRRPLYMVTAQMDEIFMGLRKTFYPIENGVISIPFDHPKLNLLVAL